MKGAKKKAIDEMYSEEAILANYHDNFEAVKEDLLKYIKLSDNSKNKDHKLSFNELWDDIRQKINSNDARINYWEERRTQFLVIALALLAATGVIITTLLPMLTDTNINFDWRTCLYLPLLLSNVVIFIGSIVLLFFWNIQNNPIYPFTKAYKIWRWYYRYAEKVPLKVKTRISPEELKKQVDIYSNNFNQYKKDTLAIDKMQALDQDLSQLYLLIINEKFKVKYVSKLRDILSNTLFLSLITLIALFLIMLFFKGSIAPLIGISQ
jgi:ABC-type multidrug transport system fused ATPase/permease subunit